MKYDVAKLLQIVAGLTEKYTGRASSSVTYETAQQLMEAVLYCIHEAEQRTAVCGSAEEGGIVLTSELQVEQAYRQGYDLVVFKVQEAYALYQKITDVFESYGNYYYEKTIMNAIPEFFKRYDTLFCPQDSVIGMDYPVLAAMESLQGIDAVYPYLQCVLTEQRFLHKMSRDFVRNALQEYSRAYRGDVINVPYIILRRLQVYMMLGKPAWEYKMTQGDFEKAERLMDLESEENLTGRLGLQLENLLRECYQEDEDMTGYFRLCLPDMAAELKNAARNHSLRNLISAGSRAESCRQ